jgi:tetratricopeptide (TPR) repeat protein
MADALPDYRQAYQYCPDNLRYAREYAGAAFSQRQYADAERGLTAALQLSRDLAARDPGAYRPGVAATLNSFGVLYRNTGRPAEAEKKYSESLTIWRDLAARDPGAYLPDRAATLDNFGNLYHHTGRPAEAEKVFSEAPNDLTIYRDLASNNPKVYAGEVELLTKRLAAVSAPP